MATAGTHPVTRGGTMHDRIATGSPDLARLRHRFDGQVLLPAEPATTRGRSGPRLSTGGRMADPDDDQAGRLPGRRSPGRVRRGLGQHPRRAWAHRCRDSHGSFVNVVITRQAGRREWIGLAVLTLPCLLYAMDLTVLNLAVPHLSKDLRPGSTQLLWIVDVYGFMAAGSLITMGTVGDRIGRRRLLLIGAAAFGVTSLLAAWSASAAMLIAARALLGLAGATVAPSTLSLIRNMFGDPRQRTVAISVWITSFSVGGAIGPLLGGVLLEWFWWG